MCTIKSLMYALFFGIAAFGLTISSAQALLLSDLDFEAILDESILSGVTNLNVGGTLYDVEFVDGRCDLLFGACSPADPVFDFDNPTDALAAAEALVEQLYLGDIIIDGTGGASFRLLVFGGLEIPGCTQFGECFSLIPYGFGPADEPDSILVAIALYDYDCFFIEFELDGSACNRRPAADFISLGLATFGTDPNTGGSFFTSDFDTSDFGIFNYARFTPSLAPEAASQVPEPASLFLFGMGLAGLAVIRRRRLMRSRA